MQLTSRFVVVTLLGLGLTLLMNNRIGDVPPMGEFLDPVQGVWQNALIPDYPDGTTIEIAGLTDEVKVVFNARGVPHIFAQNEYDLYFASGYVMAMHRLWQMDFSAHASLGRLSEIVGKKALRYDQYLRRQGMAYGAERMMEATLRDDKVMTALTAYSEGVNRWISDLRPRHLPFEYKMLGHKPEAWTPLKSLALGMNINRILSSGNRSLYMSHLEAAWGRDVVVSLYADQPHYFEPVISKNRQWDFSLEAPQAPNEHFIPRFIFDDLIEDRNPDIGSNNWAVSGSKTESGDALFASDPHLFLSLPSIWYEIQLQAPGINAYGVTFPGVPSIIMGFNNYIIWGNTNTGNEVFDLYEIELDEENKHYLHDGEWLALRFRIEEYRIKGSPSVTDTIAYTHHGPVMYYANEEPFTNQIPVAHALSWTAHDTQNVIRPLMDIATSKDFTGFRKALSRLNAPPQNYAFASVSGDIGMQLNGLWPLKWKYQGMFISDGRDSRYNWQGYIPFENLPFEFNPSRGFVSSANQHPTNSRYPYYHGWHFASPARSSIINNTLAESTKHRVEDMKNLQLNTSNFWAEKYLQTMIDSTLHYLEQNKIASLNSRLENALDTLSSWNKTNEAGSIGATIFEHWRDESFTSLWDPLLEPVNKLRPIRPSIDVSYKILFHHKPIGTYEEITQQPLNTGELLAQSLEDALNKLERNGGTISQNWQWWNFNGPRINHLLNIPALNLPRLEIGGNSQSPNAIRGTHGPSWRMVAQMSDPMKVWGVYPGGQSGNPATKGYTEFIQDWAEGNYYQLFLYDNFDQAADQHNALLILNPGN